MPRRKAAAPSRLSEAEQQGEVLVVSGETTNGRAHSQPSSYDVIVIDDDEEDDDQGSVQVPLQAQQQAQQRQARQSQQHQQQTWQHQQQTQQTWQHQQQTQQTQQRQQQQQVNPQQSTLQVLRVGVQRPNGTQGADGSGACEREYDDFFSLDPRPYSGMSGHKHMFAAPGQPAKRGPAPATAPSTPQPAAKRPKAATAQKKTRTAAQTKQRERTLERIRSSRIGRPITINITPETTHPADCYGCLAVYAPTTMGERALFQVAAATDTAFRAYAADRRPTQRGEVWASARKQAKELYFPDEVNTDLRLRARPPQSTGYFDIMMLPQLNTTTYMHLRSVKARFFWREENPHRVHTVLDMSDAPLAMSHELAHALGYDTTALATNVQDAPCITTEDVLATMKSTARSYGGACDQPDEIMKPLHPYQLRAIQWMKEKEDTPTAISIPHPYWVGLKGSSGKTLYLHRYDKAADAVHPTLDFSINGGVLADEMGLGKTLAVIGLVLCNPRPGSQREMCKDGESQEHMDSADDDKEGEVLKERENERGEGVAPLDSIGDKRAVSSHGEDGKQQQQQQQQQDVSVVQADNSGSTNSSDAVPASGQQRGGIAETQLQQQLQQQPQQQQQLRTPGMQPVLQQENVATSASTMHNAAADMATAPDASEPQAATVTPSASSAATATPDATATSATAETNRSSASDSTVKEDFVECHECGSLFEFHVGDPTVRARIDPSHLICLSCMRTCEPRMVKTTLIISPARISNQWIEEITNNAPGAVRVFDYRGASTKNPLHPAVLATYDIVVTTYSVLRKDVHFWDAFRSGRSLRTRRSNARSTPPPPIMILKWWRVCLDEAQMVESSITKIAVMVRGLPAEHRWCVTGTPMSNSVRDLFGLLAFFGVDLGSQKLFNNFLRDKSQLNESGTHVIQSLLQHFSWRSCKEDVEQEFQLPHQSHVGHTVRFNELELYCYRQILDTCKTRVAKVVKRLKLHPSTTLSELDPHAFKRILTPLLDLRKACCHPMATKLRGLSLAAAHLATSMQHVKQEMIDTAKKSCSDAFRELCFALNALAGICLLAHRDAKALDHYEQVIRSYRQYSKEFTCDRLQYLHAIHNYATTLRRVREQPLSYGTETPHRSREFEDEPLFDMEDAIHRELTFDATSMVELRKTKMDEVGGRISKDALKQTLMEWADAIRKAIKKKEDFTINDLMQRFHSYLDERTIKCKFRPFTSVTSFDGLLAFLMNEIDELFSRRASVKEVLVTLVPRPTAEDVEHAVTCPSCRAHRHNVRRDGNDCDVCVARVPLHLYEERLFSNAKTPPAGKRDTDGFHYLVRRQEHAWHKSQVHIVCDFLANQARKFQVGGVESEAAKTMQHLREEYMCFSALFTAIDERFSALDDIASCTQRLRLLPAGAPPQLGYISNIPMEEQAHQALRTEATLKLARSRGRLKYLQTLGRETVCPVCQEDFGGCKTVWMCGHCFCFQCSEALFKRKTSADCPLCRTSCESGSLEVVDTHATGTATDSATEAATSSADTAQTAADAQGNNTSDADAIPIEGDYSSKVCAVLRALRRVFSKATGHSNKVVVFSQFTDILRLINVAAKQNDIPVYAAYDQASFAKRLRAFKDDESHCALLLDVKSGSNGLNIVEAQHVFLIEPILHPGVEQQAIARVHRIGQTYNTTVHRFVVANSVESALDELRLSAIHNQRIVSSKDRTQDMRHFTIENIQALLGVHYHVLGSRDDSPSSKQQQQQQQEEEGAAGNRGDVPPVPDELSSPAREPSSCASSAAPTSTTTPVKADAPTTATVAATTGPAVATGAASSSSTTMECVKPAAVMEDGRSTAVVDDDDDDDGIDW